VQDGSTRLVYEMVITNFSNNKYVLDAVEAKAGTAQFTFAGSALAGMIIPLGAWGQPDGSADRTVNGGRSLIVFLLLDLGNNKAPSTIEHSLHVLDDKSEAHAVVLAPLVVSNETPIGCLAAAPWRLDRWEFRQQQAGRSPSSSRACRRRACLAGAALCD
jgi:hypothetical protein